MRARRARLLAAGCFLAACAAEPPPGATGATLSHATSGEAASELRLSGYTRLVLDVPEDTDLTGVLGGRLGELGILVDEVGPRHLVFTEQGRAEAGAADLVLELEGGSELVFPEVVEYLPAEDPALERIVAVGASLTQGVQGGVPSERGLRQSPGALVARQAGGHLPLPLLVPDLFPAIGPQDIGPPPECTVPDVATFVAEAAVDVLGVLVEDGEFAFERGRRDAELPPLHVAVGGSKVDDLVWGPEPEDFAGQFLARLVYAPYLPLGEELPHTQLELAAAAEPTLILCTDLVGNDVILSLTGPGDIDLEAITPVEELEVDLALAVEALAATGAEVFLATLPQPTLLPVTAEKRRALVAEGADPADVDATIAEVDAAAEAFNALLVAEAARHANVHVVDLAGLTAEAAESGLAVGDEVLRVEKFGGLLSTDGVHFSDVGYAFAANAFLDEVNTVLGTSVELVDLSEVLVDDPYQPTALEAGGLEVSACE